MLRTKNIINKDEGSLHLISKLNTTKETVNLKIDQLKIPKLKHTLTPTHTHTEKNQTPM